MQKIDIKLTGRRAGQVAETCLQVFFAEARRSRRYVIVFPISSILWIAQSHMENSSNED